MKLPKSIYFYTALLGVFGIGMGIWSTISPMGMLDIVGLTLEGTGRTLIIGFFAARNAAFGVLFLVALFYYRTRETLLTIYISRLILDIMDTTVMTIAGQMDLARVLEQALFLVPIPIIIYYLAKTNPNKSE
jgi:hypothetical protein